MDQSIPTGCFNGAYQGEPMIVGWGFIHNLSDNHYFYFQGNQGGLTNNKGKFMPQFYLFKVALDKDIRSQKV